MSEPATSDEMITIDGKEYSRALTECLARDIDRAHLANPRSWSLYRIPSGTLVLSVESIAVLSIRTSGCDLTLFGSRDEVRFRDLNPDWVRAPYKLLKAFLLAKVSTHDALEVLRQHEDAHFQAIDQLASTVRTHTLRRNDHQSHMVDLLGEALGRELLQPDYLDGTERISGVSGAGEGTNAAPTNRAEGSGNIQRLDRDLLERIADDIEIAHAINPNSWVLYQKKPQEIRLWLRNHQAMILYSDRCAFVLDQSVDHPWVREARPNLAGEKPLKRDSYLFGSAPLEIAREVLGKFPEVHEGAIRLMAETVRTQTNMGRIHKPHLVDELGMIVGRELPQPAYLSELPKHPGLSTNLQHMEGQRYWKVDSGIRAWSLMRKLGHIYYENWASEPVLLNDLPHDYEAFISEMSSHNGIGRPAADLGWQFLHEISIGDLVVAYSADQSFGWGEVVGDYEYIEGNELGQHQRDVNWLKDLGPYRHVNMSHELREAVNGLGPRELTFQQFLEAIGDSPPDEIEKPVAMMGDLKAHMRTRFAATGLHYSDQQIAAFYTALQTKGFVVLSGISGTGKSKIATGFVEMLPEPQSEVAWSLPQSDDRIVIRIKPHMRNHHNFTFPIRYLDRFPGFSTPSSTTVDVRIDEASGTGNLRYEHRNGHPAVALWVHKSLYSAMESQQLDSTMVVELSYSDDQRVVAINLTPIEDADGVADLGTVHSNHLFLSVRPDWRDSTSLLGYYNPLTQTYEWTDFLRFLIRAGENFDGPEDKQIAWFVILDEMNLAHVEYYFADLLSVIESGRDEKGWTREPLRLSYPEVLGDDDVPERELKLPPNLYIIGTVNMDETTHAFSPKVLDRAFTIELTDVDFADYPPPMNAGSGALSDGQKTALLTAFSRNGRFARIDKTEISEFVGRFPEVRDQVQALNEVLMPYRMHFGYRVFDEIVQYLAINDENGMAEFAEAFDQAVFMKVLPKFTGSRARLQSPLRGVFAWALDPDRTGRTDIEAATQGVLDYESGKQTEAWVVKPAFPLVAERVRDMLVALERDGFVSFG